MIGMRLPGPWRHAGAFFVATGCDRRRACPLGLCQDVIDGGDVVEIGRHGPRGIQNL